jgi:beta-mannosidase
VKTTRTTLDSNWRFKELNPRGNSEASDLDWMDAQVPGHVHLDLVRHGVIQDPFYRMAERSCAWVDETDWVYETIFTVEEPPANAYLLFHGLDTVAEILLNGEELGRADNMFIPHEFPVGGKLNQGENTLRVIFRSALRVGRERQKKWMESCGPDDTLPEPHWNSWGPRSFVRKAQYMYGWDWGPELVSCGIWKPVELVTVPVARILDWSYEVEFDGDESAEVRFSVEVERTASDEGKLLRLNLALPTVEIPLSVGWGGGSLRNEDSGASPQSVEVPELVGVHTVQATVHVTNVKRWGPWGIGRPHKYWLTMSMEVGGEVIEQSHGHRVGLREIELVQEDGAFTFRVNGHDVFAKGANWIPAHSFPSAFPSGLLVADRASRSKPSRLRAAHFAGMNMLRVWGGGLYESERFYEICDSLGIMVWQDFPYGCAYYPDKGEYAEAARTEAIAAVKRIRNHPSLALWCGNNENAQMFRDQWTGAANRAPRYLGEHIYHEVLPQVLAEHDPNTPYWPSSPWSGSMEVNPQSEEQGDRHNWNVWHSGGAPREGVPPGDWPNYLSDNGRFSSEFGFSASCGLTTWEKFTAPEDRWPRSPVVRWHDKTRKGYNKYLEYIQLHFPEPQTLEDLVYYSQLNQAEALKCGIEHWRRNKGRCWGTLFWQFNDCWPVQSWAIMDSELDPKAAYFACKRFYAPLLVSLLRSGDVVEAHLTSDLLEDVQGELTLSIESFDGDVLKSETFDGFVQANTATQVGEISVASVKAHERAVYVSARFEPHWEIGVPNPANLCFLAEPKDLRLGEPALAADVTESGHKFALTLTAKRFAPYVWWRLEGQPGDPRSDNFFHLRANESRTIEVPRSPDIRSVADFRSRLRLRSL